MDEDEVALKLMHESYQTQKPNFLKSVQKTKSSQGIIYTGSYLKLKVDSKQEKVRQKEESDQAS